MVLRQASFYVYKFEVLGWYWQLSPLQGAISKGRETCLPPRSPQWRTLRKSGLSEPILLVQDPAFTVATIYITFSLLICGFYIRVSEMTLSVIKGLSWTSFSKYTFQALAYTELQNRTWDNTTCTANVAGQLFSFLTQVYLTCMVIKLFAFFLHLEGIFILHWTIRESCQYPSWIVF